MTSPFFTAAPASFFTAMILPGIGAETFTEPAAPDALAFLAGAAAFTGAAFTGAAAGAAA